MDSTFIDRVKNSVLLSEWVEKYTKIVWNREKTRSIKGDFWGCCPFHQEKTASFHVNDIKGRYYCFGCHEKGGVFDLLMKVQNFSFVEAVQFIANEVGIPVPKTTYMQDNTNRMLQDALSMVLELHQKSLYSNVGEEALQYLYKRGFNDHIISKFSLGYADGNASALLKLVSSKGLSIDMLVKSGVCFPPSNTSKNFDDTRNIIPRMAKRIIFPIYDSFSRCIGFGGRAIDPHAKAKYMNSPSSQLFAKGKILYNQGSMIHSTAEKVCFVVEGYTDVIFMDTHGFNTVVAPLGTAITKDHLQLIIGKRNNIIVLLDGDKAGRVAAERLARIAIEVIRPGCSIKFVYLPESYDPDSFLREYGADSLREKIETAYSLVDVLWSSEVHKTPLIEPEQKADFDIRINQIVQCIQDSTLRHYYSNTFREKIGKLFHSRPNSMLDRYDRNKTINSQLTHGYNSFKSRNSWDNNIFPQKPQKTEMIYSSSYKKNKWLSQRSEAVLLLAILRHPPLSVKYQEEFANLDFVNEVCKEIWNTYFLLLGEIADENTDGIIEKIHHLLGYEPIQKIQGIHGVKIYRFCSEAASEAEADRGIKDVLKHRKVNMGSSYKNLCKNNCSAGDAEDLYFEIKSLYSGLHAVKDTEDSINESLNNGVDCHKLDRFVSDKIWEKKSRRR